MTPTHTPRNWIIGKDETPWTCGDSETAIANGEPLGHTEILFPILGIDNDPVAYLPWEPMANKARAEELMHNARMVASAPELVQELSEVLDLLRAIIDQGALKHVAHLPDEGERFRMECHERIKWSRSLLAEIEGTKPTTGALAKCVKCGTGWGGYTVCPQCGGEVR